MSLRSADNPQHLAAAFLEYVKNIDDFRMEICGAKFGHDRIKMRGTPQIQV